MTKPSCNASIVIPVHNKAKTLKALLSNLEKQTVPLSSFEVIAVDDGSTDGSRTILQQWKSDLDLRVIHLRPTKISNRARTRNRGIAKARGKIIILLDADVVPGARFVQAHLRAHTRSKKPVAIVGQIVGYPLEPELRQPKAMGPWPISKVLENLDSLKNNFPLFWNDGRSFVAPNWSEGKSVPWFFLLTTNCSFHRNTLKRLHGLDEKFWGWGGEDTDLGLRLDMAGIPIRASMAAWAVHHAHPSKNSSPAYKENLRRMLAKCPVRGVEWFCASVLCYDLQKEPGPELVDILPAEKPLPAETIQTIKKNYRGKLIWFGPEETLRRLGKNFAVHSNPNGICKPGTPYGLVGVFTPFANQEFDTAVVTGYWTGLGPITVKLLVTEMLRIANKVVLLPNQLLPRMVPPACVRAAKQAAQKAGAMIISSHNKLPKGTIVFRIKRG